MAKFAWSKQTIVVVLNYDKCHYKGWDEEVEEAGMIIYNVIFHKLILKFAWSKQTNNFFFLNYLRANIDC